MLWRSFVSCRCRSCQTGWWGALILKTQNPSGVVRGCVAAICLHVTGFISPGVVTAACRAVMSAVPLSGIVTFPPHQQIYMRPPMSLRNPPPPHLSRRLQLTGGSSSAGSSLVLNAPPSRSAAAGDHETHNVSVLADRTANVDARGCGGFYLDLNGQ